MRKNKYETKAKLCTGFEGLRTIDFLRFLTCQLKKNGTEEQDHMIQYCGQNHFCHTNYMCDELASTCKL